MFKTNRLQSGLWALWQGLNKGEGKRPSKGKKQSKNVEASKSFVHVPQISLFNRRRSPIIIIMATMSDSSTRDFAVGGVVSIKTTLGDEFEAQIITFHSPSSMLVLQEGSKSGPQKNIRLLNSNYIKEFTLLRQGEDPLGRKSFYIDLNLVQAREESAIRQAEIEAERIGVGVTAEAQSIFDALSKTLPVRWDKNVIVVMDQVRVCSPYHPESVSGGTPAANERVRKVLELERKRLNVRGAA